ncbi:exocyst complex protein [Thamnocephalis sphaerospora]|uniref:Exocyst complex protein n=1 Tax=Thamnocephalis sphaerospora TaxID=78915 RepID=A0A4P9XU49_9FUNG|nr:exocyst complex protein [Thamnocephalis sphaerospora]|eukprot:RKP09744.1 exocyst complex protein [Thamnocephalis sphaerospora]
MDDHLRQLTRIENFEGQFAVDDFIESVSAPLLATAREQPHEFDPKPFIQSFEATIDQLVGLRDGVEEHIVRLEDDERRSSIQHSDRMNDLSAVFNDVHGMFEHLEARISEVGNTAIQIGEQLETVDKQRIRAIEARELIEYYLEFASQRVDRLEDLRMAGPDDQLKAAIIARRINAIAKDVSAEGSEKTKRAIERYCEVLENGFLENFEEAMHHGDLRGMEASARILHEFNGGQSCVQRYLNQREFFLDSVDLSPPEDAITPEAGEWPSPPPPCDPILDDLFQRLEHQLEPEWRNIAAIFPNAGEVMQIFVQRAFTFSIQNYMVKLLNRAEAVSGLAFLRFLASSHARAVASVKAIRRFDDRVVRPSIKGSAEQDGEGASLNGGLKPAAAKDTASATLSACVDRCMEDLFAPYIENGRYLNRERQALSDVFARILKPFVEYQAERRQVIKSRNALMRKLKDAAGATVEDPHITLPEENGWVRKSTVVRMLLVHAEAMGRCAEMATSQELPKYVEAIYKLLIEQVNVNYIDAGLDAALEDLEMADSKIEPNLKELSVVRSANRAALLEQKHFKQAIMPILSRMSVGTREIIMAQRATLSELEEKANKVMNKAIDAIVAWLLLSLAKQKKKDFQPRDQDLDLMSLATPACNQCIEYLRKVQDSASDFLDPQNGEAFFTEVGVTFHSLLLDHFKKFTISATGALVLSKDIAKYQEVVDRCKIPSLSERFEMLRELGNVFLVKPEILRSLLSEGYLAKIERRSLVPFLKMREDWSSARIDQLLRGYATDAELAATDDKKVTAADKLRLGAKTVANATRAFTKG